MLHQCGLFASSWREGCMLGRGQWEYGLFAKAVLGKISVVLAMQSQMTKQGSREQGSQKVYSLSNVARNQILHEQGSHCNVRVNLRLHIILVDFVIQLFQNYCCTDCSFIFIHYESAYGPPASKCGSLHSITLYLLLVFGHLSVIDIANSANNESAQQNHDLV